jgi:flavin reductase (DIM6/NTAB) family NADH-FMN oxidoreductase RutF
VNVLQIEHFKEAVGHFATGVVVVTAISNDRPVGFTCQTFGSLSIDPLLVSFSARTSSRTWPKIRETGRLALNILSDDQQALARNFATSAVNKFEDVAWTKAPNGAPFLDGSLARLEGVVKQIGIYGDHDLAVVEIDYCETSPGLPLIYYRGDYGVPNP